MSDSDLSDSGWDSAWDAEEAERRDRHCRQLTRANLSSLPASGRWLVEATWRPDSAVLRGSNIFEKDSYEQARKNGLQLTCMRSAARIRVADPSGLIVHTWDSEGNFWLDHRLTAIRQGANTTSAN